MLCLVTDRQFGIAVLLVFVGLGGFVLAYAIGVEPLGWPFAALALGVGLWAVLTHGIEDYTLLGFTGMLVLLLLYGLGWLASRIF